MSGSRSAASLAAAEPIDERLDVPRLAPHRRAPPPGA